jgi:DNA-binding MarR family transcriptional regulator/N-acetylglutamate synthase-like GNAT family acetyltransferase
MMTSMSTSTDQIDAVRRFSHFYTKRMGLRSDGVLECRGSLSEARVIHEVAHAGPEGTTGSEIASALDLDAGYVSRLLRRLERAGMTDKARSSRDRRRVIVRLSPTGRDAFDGLQATSRTRMTDLLAGLDPASQEQLVASMMEIERILGGAESQTRRVTYRAHQPGDMGWIVQRHAELYHGSHAWDETFEVMVAEICSRFLEQYDPSCERSWIAEVDGRRAGAIALVRRSRRVGQLRLLFVEPWARGLGIGSRLVSECVAQARHVGYHRMILFTVAGLDSARRLYEAEGFTLSSEEPGHAWGKDHLEQIWELTL